METTNKSEPKYIWYFTFGCGQENAGYCLPIRASNEEIARNEMIKRFGTGWAFCYTEKQWAKAKEEEPTKPWSLERELEIVEVD